MVQGGCGLIDQEVWLSSFPYTGTKKMAAVVRDLGRHSLEPPCLHIAAGYSLMLKVTEQGASPAGLGSAPCTQPPELEQVFSREPGCCWRALWPQEQKHSFQSGGTGTLETQKGSKAATLLCLLKAVVSVLISGD